MKTQEVIIKINVNGIELFYTKSGNGSPIILLHGNGESHKIFAELERVLGEKHTVYCVDSRGHGQSQRAELNYESMSEDIAAFIAALNLQRPTIYGFSDGGIVALLVAIKNPMLLSRLIISGANISVEGFEKRVLFWLKFKHFFTRSKLIRLMIRMPEIPLSQLNTLKIPTLITTGEHDIITLEHTNLIAQNIRDSKLKIMESENHSSYVVHSAKLFDTITEFIRGYKYGDYGTKNR